MTQQAILGCPKCGADLMLCLQLPEDADDDASPSIHVTCYCAADELSDFTDRVTDEEMDWDAVETYDRDDAPEETESSGRMFQ